MEIDTNLSLYNSRIDTSDVVRCVYLVIRWLLILCTIPLVWALIFLLEDKHYIPSFIALLLILISAIAILILSYKFLKIDILKLRRMYTRRLYKKSMVDLINSNADDRLLINKKDVDQNHFIWDLYYSFRHPDFISFLDAYEYREDINAKNIRTCWTKKTMKKHILFGLNQMFSLEIFENSLIIDESLKVNKNSILQIAIINNAVMKHGTGHFRGVANFSSVGGGYTSSNGYSVNSSFGSSSFHGKIEYDPNTKIHDYVLNVTTSDFANPTITIEIGNNQDMVFEMENRFRILGLEVESVHH